MKNLGYYNGKTGLIEEMSVPMTDRAFYFGDGVYDAVMCRNNIPYLLSEHTERFFNNCALLRIEMPIEEEKLETLIKTLVKAVDGEEKFVYFHVSRGSGQRTHVFDGKTKGNLCIMITPQSVGDIYEKMNTCLVKDIRYKLCNIKTLNLLPSIMAAQLSEENGCDEAIFYRNGFITEGSHSNVSILKNGVLITAPADCFILPGVARAHLILSAKAHGIRVEERRYGVGELYSADEIIITSSSKIARGVSTVSGREVGGRDPERLHLLQTDLLNDYINSTNL